MKSILTLSLALPLSLATAGTDRLDVNEMKAPEDRRDLRRIETHFQEALPAARRATVAIELEQGSGSGVVVSEDGLILTAAHVTGGVGREFTVRFEDGREASAESLGLNAESDSAMARITEPGEYPFVPVDDGDSARLGDWVFSLGHSGGFDESRGSVARLGRLVKTSDTTVHSDCNLIGGDSGGPLFDLRGRLIGIHSRVGNRLPMNMHVPVREFRKHWDALEEGEFIGEGPFARKPEPGEGFLGVLAESWDGEGLKVRKVGRLSPAESAGIREGDVLLEMDGVTLSSRDQLKDLIADMTPGDEVAFEMLRDDEPKTLSLKLGNRDE